MPLQKKRFFPLTPKRFETSETNKKRTEIRTLESLPVTSEEICFPFAHQVARVTRRVGVKEPEVVYLITSLGEEKLSAEQWLQHNRDHWLIENGLHQRLDISHDDDRSRLKSKNALFVRAHLTRWVNSLFVHWQQQHSKPKYKTTTDFFAYMSKNHCQKALSFLTSPKPTIYASS